MSTFIGLIFISCSKCTHSVTSHYFNFSFSFSFPLIDYSFFHFHLLVSFACTEVFSNFERTLISIYILFLTVLIYVLRNCLHFQFFQFSPSICLFFISYFFFISHFSPPTFHLPIFISHFSSSNFHLPIFIIPVFQTHIYFSPCVIDIFFCVKSIDIQTCFFTKINNRNFFFFFLCLNRPHL